MDFNYLFFDTIEHSSFPKTNIYTSFPSKILDSIKLKDSTCVEDDWTDVHFAEATNKTYKCGGDIAGFNKTCNFGSYTGPGTLAWISSVFSQVDLAGWLGTDNHTLGGDIGACTPIIGNIQRFVIFFSIF